MEEQNFLQDRIVSHPSICNGKPTLKGTSIPVLEILDRIFLGFGAAEVLQEYPQLEGEDIRACLEYASQRLHSPLLEKAMQKDWMASLKRNQTA
ncbi:DUF433 domain-containing protein [Leptospira fluminis]|uniref:DUF433 domain-containing protein n=1 Tax=Leptospira fluminis TaxID=2484979 RepID=A0A4R9GSB1_9LEPT|nr:DUF433 domain-containing protein [Leptospira fluminis]TGK21064.1 DUF433 domain-containing protein [Leptospira fluminis]